MEWNNRAHNFIVAQYMEVMHRGLCRLGVHSAECRGNGD